MLWVWATVFFAEPSTCKPNGHGPRTVNRDFEVPETFVCTGLFSSRGLGGGAGREFRVDVF